MEILFTQGILQSPAFGSSPEGEAKFLASPSGESPAQREWGCIYAALPLANLPKS